jgi:signal transduction histidine kinase/CHASE3 domain sensor protein/ActR/RegA family two-component response regulator
VRSRNARSEPQAAGHGRLKRWWLDQPVRIKGMMVIAVPLVALVGVTSSSLALQYKERQSRAAGIASSALTNAGNLLVADALNAETGVRGYAATGEALFLQPYTMAVTDMPKDLAVLSAAATAERDGASERAVAATATTAMAEMARLRSEIATGISSRVLRQQLAAGKNTMDRLRRQIVSLTSGPAASLLPRRALISHMENEIDVLNLAGLVLGILAGMIGGVLFTSGISKRVTDAATNAVRLGAGQELEPVHAAGDEFGQLAGALMRAKGLLDSRAALLDRRADELTAARDEAVRATQAKNAFLSNTSHELRTPLNAVLGFTQLLQLSDLDHEDKESVQRILSAGRHLLALINELIDIARIESGGFSLSVEPVQIQQLVEETCQLMAPLAAERSITVGQYYPEPGLAVRADRQRLGQIMLNLVSNAIKYNRQGGEVSVTCRADGPDRATVAVTDTGPGISAANLERIFVPFERLGAEQTGIEGTGIGLPLALALAQAMGGQLTAASTVGEGSSFTVTLPRAPDMIPVHDDHAVPVPRAAPASPGSGAVRVLYIEDNSANIEVVSRFVRSRPAVHLQSARTGRAGLERAIREVPDLVLLDLHLPDLGGCEVLKRLKAEPATAGIPVAILSAEAAPAVIRDMRDGGVIAYLTKPLDLTELGELLDAVAASLNQVGAATRTPLL